MEHVDEGGMFLPAFFGHPLFMHVCGGVADVLLACSVGL